ncbi:MAG: hypothetical protein A2079_05575 [Geobacteraceae bacterium GWC2_48_7]|nr:MAG: hypothetical protein A2079_05575 [Geobacteraceae bacterium GWC2_48_7]
MNKPTNAAPPVFEHIFPVRYHELDSHGNIRPVTLLNYLQDIAGMHAKLLGVSVADLRELGFTWVLSRIHLIIEQFPRAEENLLVRTWPSTREGIFSCREFELLSGTGGVDAGRATTSWAVLDVATRRPVKLAGHLPPYPLFSHRAVDDSFATLPQIPGDVEAGEMIFKVLRSDLDSNKHVNNTIYAGWALEAVPDRIAEKTLAEIEISFRAEAFYGDTVTSRCAVMDNGESICLHQIFSCDDGRELARLRSRWK